MLDICPCFTETADLFTLGVFRLCGKGVTGDPITCARSVVPEVICRVLLVSLSLLQSHWPLCAVHTEQRLSCILCSSQPPLQISRTVVEGVFILWGG